MVCYPFSFLLLLYVSLSVYFLLLSVFSFPSSVQFFILLSVFCKLLFFSFSGIGSQRVFYLCSVTQQIVHTHWASYWSGWRRGFAGLNLNPRSWVFTSVWGGSTPLFYSFTSPTFWIPVYTATKTGTQPIRSMTIHFQECGTASLRYWNIYMYIYIY